tara:strand:- start:125 stop:310 length:186 start_codon:yes stop_codon:yes gene_type:complete
MKQFKTINQNKADMEIGYKESKQMYNEKDLKNAFLNGWELRNGDLPFPKAKNKWFKQLKKK